MPKLSIDLSVILNDYLSKRGHRSPYIKVFDPKFTEFSQCELDSVTELNITNSYDISELEFLPNLRVLHIKSVDYNKLGPTIDYNDSHVINHITDFSVLSKLHNLEELVIANDLFVKEIDLSGMPKLSKLILINNPNLKSIYGLDDLNNLNEVTMYGNDIDGSHFNFDRYARNTRLCVENTLDISMYLGIIGNNRSIAKHLEETEVTGESYVCFAEKSGFLNCVVLTLRDLYELYFGLDVYLKKYNAYEMSDEEKVDFVYKYIMNNTKFSEDLIIDRNILYKEGRAQYDEIPDKIRKLFNNFHSSFYAHRFKRANCEGRVNLMVFMLKMLGIEATNVHCHDNRSHREGTNHSIVRLFLNGKYVYIDLSLVESMENNAGLRSISRKGETDRIFYCVDFETMSYYLTLDSYEYSLSKKGKQLLY